MNQPLKIIFPTVLTAFFVGFALVGCSHSAQKSETPEQTALITGKIEVQGHRGARAKYPESSLAGFEYALSVGVDVLELDLGVTKDNHLVISHEPVINEEQCVDINGKRITKKIPLRSLTLEEVKTYTCGLLKHPRFVKQRKMRVKYLTLKELFEAIKVSKLENAKTVRFNIETKITPGYPELAPSPSEFAGHLISLLHEYGLVDRTVIQSFDHRTLVEARKIEPKIKLSPLFENNLPDLSVVAKNLRAEIVSPNQFWIDKETVAQVQSNGIKVIPWTANEPAEWQRLVGLGVDGIISDDPEALIAFLKSKGLR